MDGVGGRMNVEVGAGTVGGDLGAVQGYSIELSLKYPMIKAFGKKCLFEMGTKECSKAPCLISDHLHSLIMKLFF